MSLLPTVKLMLRPFLLGSLLIAPVTAFSAGAAGGAVQVGQADLVVEEVVRQRFSSRSNALINKDYKMAYRYEGLDYRAKVAVDDYVKLYSADLQWKAVKVDGIEIEDQSNAVVKYALDFSFKTPWGEVFENTSPVVEKWFYQDGEWWHHKDPNASPYSVLKQGDVGGEQEMPVQGRGTK